MYGFFINNQSILYTEYRLFCLSLHNFCSFATVDQLAVDYRVPHAESVLGNTRKKSADRVLPGRLPPQDSQSQSHHDDSRRVSMYPAVDVARRLTLRFSCWQHHHRDHPLQGVPRALAALVTPASAAAASCCRDCLCSRSRLALLHNDPHINGQVSV
jgi:hypothetical protein